MKFKYCLPDDPMATKIKKKSRLAVRKRRTRSHIIADLSVNYVERFALLNGYSVEIVEKDYGYDMAVFTYNSSKEFENGNFFIQLKAMDKPRYSANKRYISLSIDRKDINNWYSEPYPVILIAYHAKMSRAYWIYMQQFLRKSGTFVISKIKSNFTIRIPTVNIVDQDSFKLFRKFKNNKVTELLNKNVISYK